MDASRELGVEAAARHDDVPFDVDGGSRLVRPQSSR
jgi:hypothetical protein